MASPGVRPPPPDVISDPNWGTPGSGPTTAAPASADVISDPNWGQGATPATAAPATPWWRSMLDTGKDLAVGAGKQLLQIGTPGAKLINKVTGLSDWIAGSQGSLDSDVLDPTNATQAIGKTATDIGTMFLPIGEGAKLAQIAGEGVEGLNALRSAPRLASAAGRLTRLGVNAAAGGAVSGLEGHDAVAGAAGSAAGDVAGQAMAAAIPGLGTAARIGSKLITRAPLVNLVAGHLPELASEIGSALPQGVKTAASRLATIGKTGLAGGASAIGADLATGQPVTPGGVATGAVMANMTAGANRRLEPEPVAPQVPNPRSRATVVDNPTVPDTAQGWGDSRPLQANPNSSVRSPVDELRMAVSAQGPQLRSLSNVTDNGAVQDTGDPWGSALPQAAAPHTSAPIEALRAAVSPAKAPAKAPSALDSFHVVNPDTATTQVNGSGSNVGGGSDEENRRLAAMATNGQQRIVRKRTGEIVNLNDPSHVDYRVQPGEIHGIAQANGDVEVHDTGEGVTPDALAALKAQVKKMRTTNAGVASTATAKPEPIHPEIRNLYEGLQPQLDLSRENHENGTAPLPASHPALNPMTLEQFADQTMHGDPKKLWSKQRAVRKLIEAERAAKTSKGGA